MPGLTDTRFVVCESCGCKRFKIKDTFEIEKRDLGVTKEGEVRPRRYSNKKEEYFCVQCDTIVNLKNFCS